MEDRTISLFNLLREFKRKLALIVIVGLIVGLAMAGVTYKQNMSAATGLSYGSQCGIRVDNTNSEDTYTIMSIDKMRGVVLSDDVLAAAADKADVEGVTADVLKSVTYVNGSDNGGMFKIYVVYPVQEQASKLCEALGACVIPALDKIGISAEVSQAVSEMGTVTVNEIEDSTKADGYRYTITRANAPSTGIVPAAKKGVIGIVIGVVLAYLCVCFVYICRGRVVYANEINDAGLKLLGTIKKSDKNREYALKEIASNFLISDSSAKNVLLLRCGCDFEGEEFKVACDRAGIAVALGGDVLIEPLAKLEAKNADTTIVIVKSDKIKVEELYKLSKQLEEGASGIAGAILVE